MRKVDSVPSEAGKDRGVMGVMGNMRDREEAAEGNDN